MSATSNSYEHDGLTINVVRSDNNVTVAWMGESDSRNPADFLNPLMARLVKEFTGLNVTVDFSELKYMNSATVAPLIVCIKSFDSASPSVLVRFSDVDWQRTHVQCVRTISRSLKHVRIEVRPSLLTSNRPG